jgi:Putative Flp pilus-assembly TadE/G-like
VSRDDDRERGSVTAFVVVFTVALIAVAGLVADGGRIITAHREAFNEAEAAARAGAQDVDISALRAGTGVVLDPDAARQRALDYLASTGHYGTVEVDGDVVRVYVRITEDMTILGAFGIGPKTVEGEGEARAVRGVTSGEEP